METLLTIGEFSRMTHLSVKALRHYHDVGVLEPAAIDRFTGYRSYEASQVPSAQVIRRLRDLGMPLDSIRSVLAAPDVDSRNREIAAHLARMERQLEQTQTAVAGLRALLEGPPVRPAVELRTIPAVTALAVQEMVGVAGFMDWGTSAFEVLSDALPATGLTPAGPFGALFPGDFFELEHAQLTLFLPVTGGDAASAVARLPAGRVSLREIPAVEAAVVVHAGAPDDIDRTYGALGTAVAERAIGVDGPIREYYVVGFADTADESQHRTEVCWPVFLTGAKS
ncbi:MAG TPA: MerR family transcriptional regulator [Trebonia sp.]|nr:MerR family transcriptional regulator [Trebonia sp.]